MKCWVLLVIVTVFVGDAWSEEYIDMCPCLPVNMCRGVFRANHEDQMYFSRVLRCPDETHVRCCTFQVTVAAERTTKSGSQDEVTTESVLSETTGSATEEATTDELDTEDSRFDRDESTTETPTSTIENRENVDGVLVIYPTEVSQNSSGRLLRTFEGDQPEDELLLIFPLESPRETRATTSDDGPNLTTPEVPKTKKYRYNNVKRKRFMPILKINESQFEIHTPDAKPNFRVTNSENRRFLEELYKNRTRFGIPASQITTSSSPRESEILKNEVIPEERKPIQRTTAQPRRNLYYDPTRRRSFLKKNTTNEATTTKAVQDSGTKQAVDSNHREMIEEVLSELKKETNSLEIPEVVVNPSMVAKFSNMQKRLIEKIVDKISTKIERREDFEELTATTKREQTRPFRGSLRYTDTLRSPKESIPVSSKSRERKEPKKQLKKKPRRKSDEFTGDVSLPIDFRPSPLWTLQRGEDPFPVPQVPLPGNVRESRDVVPENFSWRQRGFVPIPQIPRTTPIQIIGPIPKGFTHDSSRHSTPSDLPSENAPPHFRRFTGKVFSK